MAFLRCISGTRNIAFPKTRFVPRCHIVCNSHSIPVQYISYLSLHIPCVNDCIILPYVWIVTRHYLNAYLSNNEYGLCNLLLHCYIDLYTVVSFFITALLSHQMSLPEVWYLLYWTITNTFSVTVTTTGINHAFVMPYWMLTHSYCHCLHCNTKLYFSVACHKLSGCSFPREIWRIVTALM